MRGNTVIDCEPVSESICAAIEKALSPEFRALAAEKDNPYGDGHASSKIADIVHDCLVNDRLILKKKFYDLEPDCIK